MHPDGSTCRAIEPEYLGPLADRPLAEMAPVTTSTDLFAGASIFLKGRHVERRRVQWSSLRELIDRLVSNEEHVLYVAQAIQNPPILQTLSLGYLTYAYHQVLLIVTDRRLIEILMNTRAVTPETRIRAFPWRDVRDLRRRFRRLTIVPAKGRKQTWTLPLGGDRKMLKMLLPRLAGRLLQEGAPAAVTLPVWHCPRCGAEIPPRPSRCSKCDALFRSARLTAWLSLALPGAGLLYAGHPVLALFDFLGEVLLFGVVALGLAVAETPAESIGVAVMGIIFLVMTKAESLHLGHILVTRTKADTLERSGRFRRLAMVGGCLSLLAVTGALLATGTLRPVVEHDLGRASSGGAWIGSRDTAEWNFFNDDPSARSQWTHSDGLVLTVFAYPLGDVSGFEQFRGEFHEATVESGGRILAEDETLPAPFQGFRVVVESGSAEGESLTAFNYFLYEDAGADVHQIFTAVSSEFAEDAERLIEDFLSGARWVEGAPAAR